MKKSVLLTSVFCIFIGLSLQADIPRPEHPKPQFKREAWMNLNGPWKFTFDQDLTGVVIYEDPDTAVFITGG